MMLHCYSLLKVLLSQGPHVIQIFGCKVEGRGKVQKVTWIAHSIHYLHLPIPHMDAWNIMTKSVTWTQISGQLAIQMTFHHNKSYCWVTAYHMPHTVHYLILASWSPYEVPPSPLYGWGNSSTELSYLTKWTQLIKEPDFKSRQSDFRAHGCTYSNTVLGSMTNSAIKGKRLVLDQVSQYLCTWVKQ